MKRITSVAACAFILIALSSTPAWAKQPEDKDSNELFADVGERVPEFAGVYAGPDQQTSMVKVTSTRPGLAEDLRSALIEVLGDLRPGGFEKIVLVEGASYSWLQLMEWYRPLSDSVFSLEGVTLSSIGVTENRIKIGVLDPERHSADVEAELERLHIPREAVIIHQMGVFTTTSGPASTDSNSTAWWIAGLSGLVFLALASWLIYRRRSATQPLA